MGCFMKPAPVELIRENQVIPIYLYLKTIVELEHPDSKLTKVLPSVEEKDGRNDGGLGEVAGKWKLK